MNVERKFRLIVMIIIILIGGGLSALTGLVYAEESWWLVGMLAGIICSWFLAKLYLSHLNKAFNQGNNIWLWGTVSAVFCGIVCTSIVHGIMLALIYNPDESLLRQMDGFWLLFLLIGEAIGAGAGLIIGGICSLVYVLRIKNEHRETA